MSSSPRKEIQISPPLTPLTVRDSHVGQPNTKERYCPPTRESAPLERALRITGAMDTVWIAESGIAPCHTPDDASGITIDPVWDLMWNERSREEAHVTGAQVRK